jgi:hypothetical protein
MSLFWAINSICELAHRRFRLGIPKLNQQERAQTGLSVGDTGAINLGRCRIWGTTGSNTSAGPMVPAQRDHVPASMPGTTATQICRRAPIILGGAHVAPTATCARTETAAAVIGGGFFRAGGAQADTGGLSAV